MVDGVSVRARSEVIATEEPLEIRVRSGDTSTTLGVTMRTPGSDFELAVGLLFSEGIIARTDDVERIAYCDDVDEQDYNIVTVTVTRPVDAGALGHRLLTTSACGVCGTTTLDGLAARVPPVADGTITLDVAVLGTLPGRLRERQSLFERTGGVHAAGLFTAAGELRDIREDIGRHNALDKVVGAALLEGHVPLSTNVVMVSGRSSYEIVQKAAAAGIPIVASVSAPSSLAVETANRFGLTLVGFVRDGTATVYTHGHRIVGRRGQVAEAAEANPAR